jgi:hypothetical protein
MLFVWRRRMEWWVWVLIGWIMASIVGGILASRWFRWLRD